MKIKHGLYGTPEYRTWDSIIQRCLNKNSKDFPKYGGKGINVCSEWRLFSAFFKDMGLRPAKTSIDRIDNAKGYSKENCRWATKTQQGRNKGNNIWCLVDGKKVLLVELAASTGIHRETLRYRHKKGLPMLAPIKAKS